MEGASEGFVGAFERASGETHQGCPHMQSGLQINWSVVALASAGVTSARGGALKGAMEGASVGRVVRVRWKGALGRRTSSAHTCKVSPSKRAHPSPFSFFFSSPHRCKMPCGAMRSRLRACPPRTTCGPPVVHSPCAAVTLASDEKCMHVITAAHGQVDSFFIEKAGLASASPKMQQIESITCQSSFPDKKTCPGDNV